MNRTKLDLYNARLYADVDKARAYPLDWYNFKQPSYNIMLEALNAVSEATTLEEAKSLANKALEEI